MSESLVNIESNNTLVAAGSSWGDEEEEVKPRYIAFKAKPGSERLSEFKNGHFADTEVGRSWEKMNIVILGFRKTRKFQTPYEEGKKRELLCRSANRVVPVTSDDRFTPKAADCASCPYGQKAWANFNKAAKTGKPANPCEQEVEILFIEQANPNQPYIDVVSGPARDLAEKMFKALSARSKDVFDTTGRRPETFEYVVTMVGEKGTGGNYYRKYTQIAELSAAEAKEKYGPAYDKFVVAHRAQFAARQDAKAQQQLSEGNVESKVVETPSQSVASKPEFLPPASKRVAGTKPVYVAPVLPEDDGEQTDVTI